jgi:hypothetical protein
MSFMASVRDFAGRVNGPMRSASIYFSACADYLLQEANLLQVAAAIEKCSAWAIAFGFSVCFNGD